MVLNPTAHVIKFPANQTLSFKAVQAHAHLSVGARFGESFFSMGSQGGSTEHVLPSEMGVAGLGLNLQG